MESKARLFAAREKPSGPEGINENSITEDITANMKHKADKPINTQISSFRMLRIA